MSKGRLEAFTDGVVAIIITIMVLEMKVPHGSDWHALESIAIKFWAYVLSFVFVGIYWCNHHHLYHLVPRVNGRILWANLHLLFWLSLTPFTTAWMGENHFAAAPTALYGVVLLLAAIAYLILQRLIIARHGRNSLLAAAVGRDVKGKLSAALYVIAIASVTITPKIAWIVYVVVVVMWLIPDRRIERAMAERPSRHSNSK